VSPSYPAPSWGHIDAFCAADGWSQVRETDHVHWEKVLPSGETLKTHRSMAADKPIKPNLFGLILREQLRVNREQFWTAIETGRPVERPVELDEGPPEYPAWVLFGLAKYGHDEERVRQMTPTEAERLLQELWSRPPS
jgi:hypothetical protein